MDWPTFFRGIYVWLDWLHSTYSWGAPSCRIMTSLFICRLRERTKTKVANSWQQDETMLPGVAWEQARWNKYVTQSSKDLHQLRSQAGSLRMPEYSLRSKLAMGNALEKLRVFIGKSSMEDSTGYYHLVMTNIAMENHNF